jgi:hypothetical protein
MVKSQDCRQERPKHLNNEFDYLSSHFDAFEADTRYRLESQKLFFGVILDGHGDICTITMRRRFIPFLLPPFQSQDRTGHLGRHFCNFKFCSFRSTLSTTCSGGCFHSALRNRYSPIEILASVLCFWRKLYSFTPVLCTKFVERGVGWLMSNSCVAKLFFYTYDRIWDGKEFSLFAMGQYNDNYL